MIILLYGPDGSGKSIQAKAIAEFGDNSEHLSFAVKNRKLYALSGCPSTELLSFTDDSAVNPYKTMDNFRAKVMKIIKENAAKLIVIDEITLLRKWAQPVVLEELNRYRRAKNETPLTRIGENNYAAWAKVNDLVYGELERLATWAEINDSTIVAITAIAEERQLVTGDDNKQHSVTTGRWICDAKNNIRKLADVIIRLEKDGNKGRGYYAYIEKQQGWMGEGKDFVKVDKNGLLTELISRGIIE